jgi:molybdate transport system permease protein
MKTEVLSTTVFLELSIGNLKSAVAVSVLMVAAALAVLLIARSSGGDMSETTGFGGRRAAR